jgi:hypothetical protein
MEKLIYFFRVNLYCTERAGLTTDDLIRVLPKIKTPANAGVF